MEDRNYDTDYIMVEPTNEEINIIIDNQIQHKHKKMNIEKINQISDKYFLFDRAVSSGAARLCKSPKSLYNSQYDLKKLSILYQWGTTVEFISKQFKLKDINYI